ncbi:MAG: GNAT family N-acetyltransferase [Rhodobacteraceae bacterium]|nr:GNAT family N-acetyltransferase [Paracoccaceae bacterium]
MPQPPFSFAPLTPDRIADFVALFGPSGACYGCWCTAFRLPPKDRQRLTPEGKRAVMEARITSGPPPGLLAYRGARPVGWMQIGPRADVPEWNNPGRATAPLPDGPADDAGVWAVSCFFFARDERGKGLSHAMLAAGIDHARAAGARLLEASPMDRAKRAKSIGLFVGSTTVFEKAGFTEVARRKEGRPLMRLMLQGAAG